MPADLWTLVQLDELRVDGVRVALPDLGAGARPGVPDRREPGLADLLGKRR